MIYNNQIYWQILNQKRGKKSICQDKTMLENVTKEELEIEYYYQIIFLYENLVFVYTHALTYISQN